jgi:hypothetical protein
MNLNNYSKELQNILNFTNLPFIKHNRVSEDTKGLIFIDNKAKLPKRRDYSIRENTFLEHVATTLIKELQNTMLASLVNTIDHSAVVSISERKWKIGNILYGNNISYHKHIYNTVRGSKHDSLVYLGNPNDVIHLMDRLDNSMIYYSYIESLYNLYDIPIYHYDIGQKYFVSYDSSIGAANLYVSKLSLEKEDDPFNFETERIIAKTGYSISFNQNVNVYNII